jgi:hypothetical protein
MMNSGVTHAGSFPHNEPMSKRTLSSKQSRTIVQLRLSVAVKNRVTPSITFHRSSFVAAGFFMIHSFIGPLLISLPARQLPGGCHSQEAGKVSYTPLCIYAKWWKTDGYV